MSLSSTFNAFKSSKFISWKPTGRVQQTLAGCIERTGKSLHSGKVSTVKLWPGFAGEGRYFDFRSNVIPASIDYATESPNCTTLRKDGYRISTVEHLLSALEAMGVDNCRIEMENSDPEDDDHVEVPIFDGSASEWVKAIEQVGLKVATDECGKSYERMAAHVNEPVHILKNGSVVAAFPSPEVRITYGIGFPQAPAIGYQCLSSASFDSSYYTKQIASSRTFCLYEEVEKMRNLGLIKGGGLENGIVCRVAMHCMLIWHVCYQLVSKWMTHFLCSYSSLFDPQVCLSSIFWNSMFKGAYTIVITGDYPIKTNRQRLLRKN